MCGIFGIYSKDLSHQIIHDLINNLHLLQHRGKDGAGIGYNVTRYRNKYMKMIKKYGLVKENLVINDINCDLTHACIGHVKYSTSGKSKKNNKLNSTEINELQPLIGENKNYDKIMIVHNGNIPNIEGFDTQVLLDLILDSKENIETTLINIMNTIPVAYCLLIIVNDILYVMRDRFGIRPLSIGEYNGCFYVSSETRALENCENIRDVDPGTVMRIDENGCKTIYEHPESVNGICALELLYFMNPRSIITGITIESIRINLGQTLAKKEQLINNKNSQEYIVVGIPNSGLIYAKAYAEYLLCSYAQLIEKNDSCSNGEDRTFILINDEERQNACRKKFKYDTANIKDKKLILVDDTIVRGNVIKTIVESCKKCGAAEIHIRIPAPPVIDRCQLGIAIHNKEELIMNNRTIDDVRDLLGINSLSYLSISDLTMFPKDSYMEFFGCKGVPPLPTLTV